MSDNDLVRPPKFALNIAPPSNAVRHRHASDASLETLRTRFTFLPPAHDKSASFFIDNVTFLVEKELFKVPRVYFEKNSSIFSDMFQAPTTKDREGSTSSYSGIMVFTEKAHSLSRYVPQPVNMTIPEWISVLKLATLWRFGELRIEAIEELTKQEQDPLEKIVLGREYRVEAWLLTGYKELIQRDSGLTQSEKKKLGDAAIIKIYEAREATVRTGEGAMSYGFNGNRDMNSLDTLVRGGFGAELDDARYDGEAVEEDAKLAQVAGRPKKMLGKKKGKK
ncbi:hypothetical protein FIBSPDRAFT_1021607 [Athelia psychrophila]|uniref:BTB domain-containing protein n=1 Tax=Athelia psychrophila TaxID=1759441 RepID=A0A166JLR1_9AGAM|nr:hypothetical protein FIBSPDRAFT_1021607 [Fibularhizoctonia sp. CBS 109695]